MSTRRPPSQPPRIPGFTVERHLGSGGFADVFLYQQERPRRKVAVKVLLEDLAEGSVRDQFEAEANVMAHLSTHPSIVTIHMADVSEQRRPYIVMEYCPRRNYGERFRTERISVQETLAVGVQIAGAVETAHRAGILHRDIKPANILLTEYRRPALTDFGIAIAVGGHSDDLHQGMSVPWAPPEVFRDPPYADARSDVFSLAATLYSLLAGRTPFESAHGANSTAEVIARITQQPLPPLQRPDVPEELMRVLATAMEKDPAARYGSALAFGLALQQVERLLALPVTSMDVLDNRAAAPVDEEDDALDEHTRIRRVTTVDPYAPTAQPSAGRAHLDRLAGVAPALSPAAPSSAALWEQPAERTVIRPADSLPTDPPRATPLSEEPDAPHQPRGSGAPTWLYFVLAAVLVVGVGLGATFAARQLIVPQEDPAPTAAPVDGPTERPGEPDRLDSSMVMAPEDSTTGGRIQVAWEPPADFDEEHDHFMVRWKNLPENYADQFGQQDVRGHTSVVLVVPPKLPGACVEVQTVRDAGTVSDWVEHCPPVLA